MKEPMPGTIDLHEVCNTIANDLQDALRLNSFPLVIEAIQHHTGTKVSRSYLIQRTEKVQLGYQGPWPTAQKLVALWNTLQAWRRGEIDGLRRFDNEEPRLTAREREKLRRKDAELETRMNFLKAMDWMERESRRRA